MGLLMPAIYVHGIDLQNGKVFVLVYGRHHGHWLCKAFSVQPKQTNKVASATGPVPEWRWH